MLEFMVYKYFFTYNPLKENILRFYQPKEDIYTEILGTLSIYIYIYPSTDNFIIIRKKEYFIFKILKSKSCAGLLYIFFIAQHC